MMPALLCRPLRTVTAVLCWATLADAQTTSASRDTPIGVAAAPADNGAAVRGRVLDGLTGLPLRNAEVLASPLEATGTPNAFRTTATDSEGWFQFDGLSAVRYRISAAHYGYVQGAHGQSSPLDPPQPVALMSNKAIDLLEPIRLFRGGFVSGLVLDERGEPVPGRTVQLIRRTFRDGLPRVSAVPSATALTNDLGAFSVGVIPPGSYFVAASAGLDIVETEQTVYRTTYYPATTLLSEGRSVHVELNRETSGIVITLTRGRMVRVSGAVTRANGELAGEAMVFRSREVIGGSMGTGDKTPDGRFALENLVPGDYTFWGRLDTPAGREEALVRAELTEDIADLVLALHKDVSVRGRLVIDGDSAQLRPDNFRIRGVELEFPDFTNLTLAVNADWALNGTSFAGLTWLFRPTLPTGWYLRRVTIGGREVTDTPVQLANDVSDMEIVVTRQVTTLRGRVAGADGTRATVVVFATASERWTPYTRYVQRVQTDTSGSFDIRGLPPGRYAAVALPSLADGEEGNPELLRRWLESGSLLELNEGEARELELSLAL